MNKKTKKQTKKRTPTKKRRPRGMLKQMSDTQLLTHTHDRYGKTITRGELQKEDSWLYTTLKNRHLIRQIPTKLTRKGKKPRDRGTLKEMDNTQILDYTYKTQGREITRGKLSKNDCNLYDAIRERQLLHHFPLAPTKTGKEPRSPGTLQKLNDTQLVAYTYKTHGEKTTRNEIRKDGGLYLTLLERQLLHHFPLAPTKKGRKQKEKGTLKKMSDKQLLAYANRTHGKKTTRTILQKEDNNLYKTLRTRQLMHHFPLAPTTTGKEQKEKGYWDHEENVKNETWKVIDANNGIFPTIIQIKTLTKSSLRYAWKNHYGGKYQVMEAIGYNKEKEKELARNLETIIMEL